MNEFVLSPVQKLAIKLHETHCSSCHTDECGWYYRNNNDPETWENDLRRKEYVSIINTHLNKGMTIDECEKHLIRNDTFDIALHNELETRAKEMQAVNYE